MTLGSDDATPKPLPQGVSSTGTTAAGGVQPPGASTLFLRIPMAWMAEVPDVTAFDGLPADGVQAFRTQYEADEQQSILNALTQALADPAFDFEALMLPLQGRPVPPNGVIREFLTQVLHSLGDR